VEPKPHPLTVAAMVLTAVLTLVAVWLAHRSAKSAEESIELSRETMIISQQAYLVIRSTGFTVAPLVGWLDPGFQNTFHFEVHNVGNTPARKLRIKVEVIDYPKDGYAVLDEASDERPTVVEAADFGDIGPQSFRRFESSGKLFVGSKPGRTRRRDSSGGQVYVQPDPRVMAMKFDLQYTNAFSQPRSLEWCWLTDIDEGNPGECSDLYLEDLKKRKGTARTTVK
jgi:hypothetical protein